MSLFSELCSYEGNITPGRLQAHEPCVTRSERYKRLVREPGCAADLSEGSPLLVGSHGVARARTRQLKGGRQPLSDVVRRSSHGRRLHDCGTTRTTTRVQRALLSLRAGARQLRKGGVYGRRTGVCGSTPLGAIVCANVVAKRWQRCLSAARPQKFASRDVQDGAAKLANGSKLV